MKKIIVLLTVVALITLFGMTAFAAPVIITGFDAEDISAFMNHYTGLDSYAARPVISLVDAQTGKGAKVELPKGGDGYSTSDAWVQTFLMGDNDMVAAFNAADKTGKRMAMYIKNNLTDGNIALRLSVNNAGVGAASFNMTQAKLIAMNGSSIEIATADGGGAAADSAVIIPAGFEGCLYVPFSACNVAFGESWGRGGLLTDFSTATNLEIDVRVTFGASEGGSYILDNLCIVGADEPIIPTADLSVIAYAAAAVIGCGALVVGKRK